MQEVTVEGEYLVVNGQKVKVLAERDPAAITMGRTRSRNSC